MLWGSQQDIDLALAAIHNDTDLQAVLSHPSALDVLDDELTDFVNSVRFTHATPLQASSITFDQQILRDNLSASEIYNILVLFGQQHTITQYSGAVENNDIDKLLLQANTLPFCNGAFPIDLIVTVNKQKQAHFAYTQQGTDCDGNVELTENTTITYQLKHKKKTPKGLRLIGAGFTNPFDAHVKSVSVSQDGQSISLKNNIENLGVSKYQFMLTSNDSNLVLLSPVPEVVNRPGQN